MRSTELFSSSKFFHVLTGICQFFFKHLSNAYNDKRTFVRTNVRIGYRKVTFFLCPIRALKKTYDECIKVRTYVTYKN